MYWAQRNVWAGYFPVHAWQILTEGFIILKQPGLQLLGRQRFDRTSREIRPGLKYKLYNSDSLEFLEKTSASQKFSLNPLDQIPSTTEFDLEETVKKYVKKINI